MFPNLAFNNSIDGGIASPDMLGNFGAHYPLGIHTAYIPNFVGREESVISIRASAKFGPVMFKIFSQSHPFKIARAIVQFIAVDMINGVFVFGVRMKGHCYKAVDFLFNTSTFVSCIPSQSFVRSGSDMRSHVSVDIETAACYPTRTTNAAKGAGRVSRVLRDNPPMFSFHNAGCIDKTRLTQGSI